jgi:hypothetical protein
MNNKEIKEKLKEDIKFYTNLEYRYAYALGSIKLSMKAIEIKEKIERLLEIL